MCVQCFAGAMTATAGASGARAWLATRRWAWLTPRVFKRITVGLLAIVLLTSSLLIGGTAAPVDAGREGASERTGEPSGALRASPRPPA